MSGDLGVKELISIPKNEMVNKEKIMCVNSVCKDALGVGDDYEHFRDCCCLVGSDYNETLVQMGVNHMMILFRGNQLGHPSIADKIYYFLPNLDGVTRQKSIHQATLLRSFFENPRPVTREYGELRREWPEPDFASIARDFPDLPQEVIQSLERAWQSSSFGASQQIIEVEEHDVADMITEAEEDAFLKEAKEITGKCKALTERIVGLGKEVVEEEVRELVKEWVELLQPSRVDWVALLEWVMQKDWNVYLKMAERILDEPSFEADIRDYSILIDAHVKENRVEDIKRLLKGMSEKGIKLDVITLTSLQHMYSKSHNSEQAKEIYEALCNSYKSMIMAYINAGQPESAEALLREMELIDFMPLKSIYMALLRAFAKRGDHDGAQRIVTKMEFAGFQPTAESCTLLIEACAKSGNQLAAKNNFDKMMGLGFKPDDKSTSLLLFACEKNNKLDYALSLLLELELEGFKPGVLTYSVMIDWLGKVQLVDEAEEMLARMAQLGEAPSLKIQVRLCEMYARPWGFWRPT